MRKTPIFLILLLLFILAAQGTFFASNTAHAWVRDANIADSQDSVGIGTIHFNDTILTIEKILNSQTSLGFYYYNYTCLADVKEEEK